MVEENRCQSRGDLLDDIKRGSRLLEQQLSQFIDWIGDRKIVSFAETQQTKKLQKVQFKFNPLNCLRLTVLSNLTEPGLELGSILRSLVETQPSYGYHRLWKRG